MVEDNRRMHIDLDAIPFQETRHKGVSVHFYHSNRASGHAAVMVKMLPGCSYPRHRHRGPEELLILQGGFRDEHGEYRAGEYRRSARQPDRHAPVRRGGPGAGRVRTMSGPVPETA